MKLNKILPLVILLLATAPAAILADGGVDEPVARDEALVIKNNLRAVLDGLGAPPTGYAKAKEIFDLPTAMGLDEATRRFWLSEASAVFEFTRGLNSEQLGQELQKKIMAAQAKGDYAEIQRLSTEVQQTMMSAMDAETSKVTVDITLNQRAHQTIDPEGVVWELPGAIALRVENNEPNSARIMLAFDPKALADTKSLSLVSLGESFNESAAAKIAVRTIVVELTGPDAVVTEWAQSVDKGRILGLVRE
jgi:hypothetical protein